MCIGYRKGSWIGVTDFREVAEYIDDDSDEETEVKELGECLAKPLTEVPFMGPGQLETAPKEELEFEESVKAPRLTGKPLSRRRRNITTPARRKTTTRNP